MKSLKKNKQEQTNQLMKKIEKKNDKILKN